MAIPKHSTIATVCENSLLKNPEDYVLRVLEKMGPHRLLPNGAYVRIGVLGDGEMPNYRIEHGHHVGTPPTEDILGAFRGNGHNPLAEKEALQKHTWSSETLPYATVQAVMGAMGKPSKLGT